MGFHYFLVPNVKNCDLFPKKIYHDSIEPFYQISKEEFGEHVCLEFLRPPYYQIWMKSNIEDRCNYNPLGGNKWCNHDTIEISPIFKMAAAAILDFEKKAIVGA